MESLEKFRVSEMNTKETASINGGNWISDAWDDLVETAEKVAEDIKEWIEEMGNPNI